MGQALIRNLDDDLIADYRAAAERAGRSLEAEYRDGLSRARPIAAAERRVAVEAVRKLLPETVPGPDSSDIIRWYRDTQGGRDIDAFGG